MRSSHREYIKYAIEELGVSQNELTEKIGITGETISKIISDMIILDIAEKLSDFFETSINIWLNLQIKYNEYKTR